MLYKIWPTGISKDAAFARPPNHIQKATVTIRTSHAGCARWTLHAWGDFKQIDPRRTDRPARRDVGGALSRRAHGPARRPTRDLRHGRRNGRRDHGSRTTHCRCPGGRCQAPNSYLRFEGTLSARLTDSFPAPCRGFHWRFRGGAGEPPAQRLPAKPRASQYANRRDGPRYHGACPLARAQQRLRGQRHRELGRNVVGAGIKPSSLIKDAGLKAQVQKLWLDWTDEADAEGFTDFYGLQRRAAREVFIAGEVFFRFRPRRPQDGLTVPLQLQMLPSECCRSIATRSRPAATSSARALSSTPSGGASPTIFCAATRAISRTLALPATSCASRPPRSCTYRSGRCRATAWRLAVCRRLVKLFLLDQYDDADSTGRRSQRCTRSSSLRRRRPSRSMRRKAATRMMSARSTCSRGRSPCWSPAKRCRLQHRPNRPDLRAFQYRTLLQVPQSEPQSLSRLPRHRQPGRPARGDISPLQ